MKHRIQNLESSSREASTVAPIAKAGFAGTGGGRSRADGSFYAGGSGREGANPSGLAHLSITKTAFSPPWPTFAHLIFSADERQPDPQAGEWPSGDWNQGGKWSGLQNGVLEYWVDRLQERSCEKYVRKFGLLSGRFMFYRILSHTSGPYYRVFSHFIDQGFFRLADTDLAWAAGRGRIGLSPERFVINTAKR